MWLLMGGYRNRSKSYTPASLIINSDFVKILKTPLECKKTLCRGSAGCSDKQTSCLSPNPKRGRRKTLTTHLNADEWNQDEKFFLSFFHFWCSLRLAAVTFWLLLLDLFIFFCVWSSFFFKFTSPAFLQKSSWNEVSSVLWQCSLCFFCSK